MQRLQKLRLRAFTAQTVAAMVPRANEAAQTLSPHQAVTSASSTEYFLTTTKKKKQKNKTAAGARSEMGHILDRSDDAQLAGDEKSRE